MALYDLSLKLRVEQPGWPDDPPFSIRAISSIARGDACNVSFFETSSHFATHLDAPYHFIEDGARVDDLSLDTLIGRVLVHEVDTPNLILPDHLPNLDGVERILFKTSNSQFIEDAVFHTYYVSIGLETARELVRAGVKLAGIDYFSIEAFRSPGYPVHHELCGNGVILLEGLNLHAVEPGWYELIALPLKIEGCDGSPCRVVLRDLTE